MGTDEHNFVQKSNCIKKKKKKFLRGLEAVNMRLLFDITLIAMVAMMMIDSARSSVIRRKVKMTHRSTSELIPKRENNLSVLRGVPMVPPPQPAPGPLTNPPTRQPIPDYFHPTDAPRHPWPEPPHHGRKPKPPHHGQKRV